ncbi:hypothetical protein F503_00745 [Ophiostoma piceae UAMH 11346]|uniref:Uncharacterized protein n=1 Tax=Ophiostoma piceae (strain UAMH 11346) TaxID=1262450 RepID=S3C588_OPHP1|nr:hypothetical protein F503_00745 [Ophiostoma piceae UAMH 11346]
MSLFTPERQPLSSCSQHLYKVAPSIFGFSLFFLLITIQQSTASKPRSSSEAANIILACFFQRPKVQVKGLVFVYACRHRQVGEVRICHSARRSASNAGCLASLTFMLTGKEPSRQCGDIKTSRRYLIEPCLACRGRADMSGDITAESVNAFSGNSQNGARPVLPPVESGAFTSDPSGIVKRPYVGEVMPTAAGSAATVAVAITMPQPVVVAKSRSGRGHRSSSAGPSFAGPSSDSRSGSRSGSRGRTMTTGSGSGSNSSRSRSTSRGRAAAANSANRLPGSHTSSRRSNSNSAAKRYATAPRLSTVQEDAIPMVPMVPTKVQSANGQSGVGSSSARVAPPGPARRVVDPSRTTVAATPSPSFFSRNKGKATEATKGHGKGKDVKGKGKEIEKVKQTKNKTMENTKASKPSKPSKSSSSRSPTFSERDRSIRSIVANSEPAASLGLGVHRYSTAHRHAASGFSSGSATGRVASYAGPSFSGPSPSANTRRSPPRNISDRLRSMRKVAKSEESLVCADAARIEGKGNFF